MHQLDVVTVPKDLLTLVDVRSIPDVEPEFLSGSPEQVLRRVLIMTDPHEGFSRTIDGDNSWICEHVLLLVLVPIYAR